MTDTGGSPVAVLGGTFDPVHWGHIRPAVELLQALGLSEVRMVPVSVPPHRSQPRADATLRYRLLRLAVEDVPGLVVDDRELRRAGASYTVDTLASLRRELGSRRPLCFIMGSDAFRGLTGWHRWQQLNDLAHLVVTTRGGDVGGGLSDTLDSWLTARQAANPVELRRAPAGRVWFQPVSQLEISATALRQSLAQGRSVRGLVPDRVWAVLSRCRGYGYPQQ